MRFPSVSTKTDVRSRLSRGSVLVHIGHVQPVSGTPVDVPVPRNVIFILFGVFEDRITKLHKFCYSVLKYKLVSKKSLKPRVIGSLLFY